MLRSHWLQALESRPQVRRRFAAERRSAGRLPSRERTVPAIELLEDRTLLDASGLIDAAFFSPEIGAPIYFIDSVLEASSVGATATRVYDGDMQRAYPIGSEPTGTAEAGDAVTATPLEGDTASAVNGVVYSNMGSGSGFQAFAAATGPLGFDDYDSINNENINLTQLKFVGGVQNAGGELRFEFYDTASNFVSSVTFTFADAGNFIYTLPLGSPITVPDAGILQVVALPGTTGQWFLSNAAPTTGTQSTTVGGADGGALSHKFELTNTIGGGGGGNVDLAPAIFSGWSDAILISTTTGTNTDNFPIAATDTVFIDVGVGNFGTDATSGSFTIHVKMDGATIHTFTQTASMNPSTGFMRLDINAGSLANGIHLVELFIDTGSEIAETNENNNYYSRTFFVGGGDPGQVSGALFDDADADGVQDTGEAALSGWTVFVDVNSDSERNTGEPFATTVSNGTYTITGVTPGTYDVAFEVPAGWVQTSPTPGTRLAPDYTIDVIFPDSSLTSGQQAAFTTAANRWAEIIFGDLADLLPANANGFFVDDLIITATGVAIDGPSGILGQAGPTVLRSGSSLPAMGQMQFDTADLAEMESDGSLVNVILHEMGHVIGIGTIWNALGLLTGAGGSNPQFTGAGATAEYNAYFGISASSVPVENSGGAGTRDSHWLETRFNNELMTGFLNPGSNPISRITTASLGDLGYQVNVAAADPYTPPGGGSLVAAPSSTQTVSGWFLRPENSTYAFAESDSALAAPSSFASLEVGALTHTITVKPGETVIGVDFGAQTTAKILNDDDTGVTVAGAWNHWPFEGFENDLHSAPAGTGADTASWAFSTTPGQYRIAATWVRHANRASNAPFTIMDGSTPVGVVRVNQSAAPDDFAASGGIWEYLGGTYTVTENTLSVQLSNDADGIVIADAVRIERVGDLPTGPEVAVALDGMGDLTDGGSLSFGSTVVGTAVSKTFSVKNVGTTNLTVQPVSVPSGFTVTINLGASQVIAPGATAVFTVNMDAATVGTHYGTLSFASTDGDENPFNISISGTVAGSVPAVQDDDDNSLDAFFFTAGSSWVHYPHEGRGGDVTFAPAGTGSELAQWNFDGLTPGQYRIWATWTPHPNRATDAPFVIYDGGIERATVRVNQESAPDDLVADGSGWRELGGPYSIENNDLTVHLRNDADEFVIADAIRIERVGDAVSNSEISVLTEDGINLLDGVSSFDFGLTSVGTPVSRTFVVRNLGTTNLTLQPIAAPLGFSVTSNFTAGQVVLPNDTALFTIRLDAGAAGTPVGTVTLGNNDADENPFTFNVSGMVTAATIIDNGTAGFSAGNYTLFVGQGYQNDVHYRAAGTGSEEVSWTFTGLAAGQYRVWATWSTHSNRATDAPYTIYNGSTPLGTVDVNQEIAPDDLSDAGWFWEELGGPYSITGSTLVVKLTDDANEFVIADAIRILRIGDLPPVAPDSTTEPVLMIAAGEPVAVPSETLIQVNDGSEWLSANQLGLGTADPADSVGSVSDGSATEISSESTSGILERTRSERETMKRRELDELFVDAGLLGNVLDGGLPAWKRRR